MEAIYLLITLTAGFLVRQVHLPPMAGFLGAGFVLHAIGAESSSLLQSVADLGVTLLLFTIGLKLRLRNLLAPQVWAVGSLHTVSYSALLIGAFMLIASLGLSWFPHMDLTAAALVAFALSFSSTIFAIKILEERGELKTRHGQITIGILIIQDIVAVMFLTFATGKLPSPWAITLLALPLLRPLLFRVLERSGHGEVLILYGIFLAIGGGELFALVGMKPDLGALIFGILLSGHHKTNEMAESLLGFKNIFLVGFFLTIGLNGLPTHADLMTATLIVLLLLPIKSVLFYLLMALFKLRARTAFLASNDLSNYSEFGLIVAAVATSAGWLSAQWLTIIAVALALSYVAAALFNTQIHTLYARIEKWLHRVERHERLPQDQPVDLGDSEILILGAGRVGLGAYKIMESAYPGKVVAVDADAEMVRQRREMGVHALNGDAEDYDFWQGTAMDKVHLVMLAMPTLSDMREALKLMRAVGYSGKIAAVTKYADDHAELEKLGVDCIYNIYAEAGAGFAEHVRQGLEQSSATRVTPAG